MSAEHSAPSLPAISGRSWGQYVAALMDAQHKTFHTVEDLVQDALDGGFSWPYVVALLSSRSNLRTRQTLEGLRAGVASPVMKKDKRWVVAFKRALWAL